MSPDLIELTTRLMLLWFDENPERYWGKSIGGDGKVESFL